MNEAEITEFGAILAWRNESAQRGAEAAEALMLLPPSSRAAALAADESLRSIEVLESLLDVAHQALDRAPAESLAITDVVLPWMSEVSVPEGADTFVHLFHSTAWKERGWALRATGNLLGALDAVERSLEAAANTPGGARARADAQILESFVRHELGDTDAAFAVVSEAEAAYVRANNVGSAIKARMMKAALVYETGDYTGAERIWVQALADAEFLGDRASIAGCFGNLGHCAEKIGRVEDAFGYFTKALPLLSELRMDAERPRVLWGLARVCKRGGRSDRALKRLHDVRKEFLALGMPLDAQCVALDILELLMHAHRIEEVRAMSAEVYETFEAAGMKANALAALAYLRDALASDALSPEPIHRVRSYIALLRQDPAAPFAA